MSAPDPQSTAAVMLAKRNAALGKRSANNEALDLQLSRTQKTVKSKTVHVIPTDGDWAVTREGGKTARVFSTQREAIESARVMVRAHSSGQLVVHGRNGRIRDCETYGMPPIQDPPGKKSVRIEKAVDKITRDRLGVAPLPPRG